MVDTSATAGIKSHKEFEKTPAGWARYWSVEIDAAKKAFEKWRKGCETIVKEYLDDRPNEPMNRDERRLNYFWSSVATKKALLFANDTPGVDVTRRFGDAEDDMARISGPLIMKRVLDTDIEKGLDGYKVALRYALLDYLMFGFGSAWIRYERKEENGRLLHEDVPVDYIHHDDYLHSPCKIFEEMRWAGKRVQMTEDEVAERFGAELAVEIALTTNRKDRDESKDPWDRVDIWEIWSKEFRKVFWWTEGFDKILDIQDDVLQLRDFWPFPRPMVANITTTAFMPRPDFALVQDIYRDINDLMSRIHVLEKALRLAGVYDRSIGEIGRLVDGSLANELIPVENMAALADKGGLDGVISWMSLKEIVEALTALEDKLANRQQLLYELTGMSELTQGAADPDMERESAFKTRARVRFTNLRTQAAQDEFARFASDLQYLRAEAMVKHYDPGTFLKRSNVLFTPDAPMALSAVMELKKEFPSYRIKITSDDLAAQDFAALKQERGEFLQAFAAMMRDGLPMIQMFPTAAPLLLETVKWALAGLRGSASIEAVFDRMLRQTSQALASGQMQKPDPEQQKAILKMQTDAAANQAKLQLEQQKALIQIQAEAQRQALQTQANVAETAMEQRLKMQTHAQEVLSNTLERADETRHAFMQNADETRHAFAQNANDTRHNYLQNAADAKFRPKPTGGKK